MDYNQIMANVEELLPQIGPLSKDLEINCTLPQALVEMLREAGCFRICMPKSWGGPELTSMEQVRLIERLSTVSSAAGWCVMIGSDSGIYSGYLDQQVARELYPNLDMVQAGWVYPGGKAVDEGDHYRVTGQWTFGSGIKHADRIAAGCVVVKDGEPVLDSDGKQKWIIVVGEQDDFNIIDNWNTIGLRGTGSHDYYTKNQVFAKAHSFCFFDGPQRDGVLWARHDAFLRKMAGIPLGVCRNALDFAHGFVRSRKDFNSQQFFATLPAVQSKMAELEMRFGAARAYLYDSLERQWSALETKQPLDNQLRADVWMSRLNVFRTTRDIIIELGDVVGGSTIRVGKTPLEQAMRDSLTWCQHVVGKDSGYQAVGNLLLTDTVSPGFMML